MEIITHENDRRGAVKLKASYVDNVMQMGFTRHAARKFHKITSRLYQDDADQE